MKTHVLVAAASLLAACGQPTAQPSPAPTSPVEAAPASAPAGRLMSPDAYVQGFYKQEPKWDTPEALRALFEPVLADALSKDMSHPGEVGVVNFMFTCGCQDGEIKNVTTSSREVGGGYEVTANFTNEGEPAAIVYRLITTPAGYRIADVSSPARPNLEAWSLRRLMELPPLAG